METINFGEENKENTENMGSNNSAPKAPVSDGSKRKKKLIAAGVVLAVLILSIIAWQYWQYTQSPYYKQMQAVKTLENMAKESDKWGGKTPEETVALFTDAVKKGDFELAGKYGITEIQSEIKNTLNTYKNSEYWQDYLVWLDSVKKNSSKDYDFGPNSVTYESFDDQGRRVVFISLGKSEGGTWKIDEF